MIGNEAPTFIAVMEFPNVEAISEVFDSEEYKKLIPYREKAFSNVEAYISQ